MKMLAEKVVLLVGATLGFLALGAHAQSGTSSSATAIPTSGIDACILTCVTAAATSAGCGSLYVIIYVSY